MKIVNKKENSITFTLKIDESLANALRRYINQIPTYAIENVEISKNDSPLYDETLAHRLGLIPLKNDSNLKEKKDAKIALNMKKEGFVYSADLKGDLKPAYDNIPLTILKKDQEIDLVCFINQGKGEEHSKFSPGLMFYRNIFEVKIDKDCPLEVVEICPQKILKNKNGKVVVEEEFLCDMCEACSEYCKKKGKKPIEFVQTKELLITLESFGQFEINNLFKKAGKILKEDLIEFSKKITKA